MTQKEEVTPEDKTEANAGEQPKRLFGGVFGCYMQENRAQLINECVRSPELLKQTSGRSGPAALQLGSERFKQLDPLARAEYVKMYEAKKQKYKEELATFKENGGRMKKNAKKKASWKAQKKTNEEKLASEAEVEQPEEAMAEAGEQPKRVTGGPFGRYMAEHRSELIKECARMPELMKDTSCRPGPAAFKLGAERFKELDAETRAKYEKIDEAAKQEYEEKLAAYKDAGGTMKKNAKKKEKRKKKEEAGPPVKKIAAAGA